MIYAQDANIPSLILQGYTMRAVNSSATYYNIGKGPRLLEVYHDGTTAQLIVTVRPYGDSTTTTLTSAVSQNKLNVNLHLSNKLTISDSVLL
jgi:hypothetical protein